MFTPVFQQVSVAIERPTRRLKLGTLINNTRMSKTGKPNYAKFLTFGQILYKSTLEEHRHINKVMYMNCMLNMCLHRFLSYPIQPRRLKLGTLDLMKNWIEETT